MSRRMSMKSTKLPKRLTAAAMSAVMCGTVFVGTAASTSAVSELTPSITYTNGDYTFEKISHPNSPIETADGIVDYIGNGSVVPYEEGVSNGEGDRGQSYSYASAVYGDWVYINTMYGGLGVSSILKAGMNGLDAETAKAFMDVMYNGNLYTGEPDGQYAGGLLLKFNVKTGETKILMSRDVNHLIPTFRSACEINGKLYFVGMVVDTERLTAQEVATAIAMQNGFPCIYEIDPENDDKLTCIYDCVDVDGYRELVADGVFTSTRAIGTYKNSLIAGCLDTEGVFLCASDDPSAGQDSFKVIATMDDLFNYPAYHRSDVNGGGGIYQVIEYNDKLYVVICTGTADSKNAETGTLKTFAIVRGECNGEPTDADAWTWSVLAGDEADGAKYPFGLDEERVSAGACTLEVYNDYLYIGDYNDVSSALQGFVLRKDFTTQATNLEQSINLYRMDKDENIEMIVGDPTERFPEGGISGLGSGYETHMSQYTWQMTVYEDKLYVSTMDTTTLLEPIAQFTNGDLLEMSPEEWESQINYLRVLLELLSTSNEEDTATTVQAVKAAINEAAEKAAIRSSVISPNVSLFSIGNTQKIEPVTITEEQEDELISDLIDGSITDEQISEEQIYALTYLNNMLDSLAELIETNNIEDFAEIYSALLEYYNSISDKLPEKIKPLYEMILSYATKDNLNALAKSVKYMSTSVAGFDLYEIQQNDDGSVEINTITNNGFGDRFNHGLRIFAKTTDYLLIGTANPFYGTQLWRRANTEQEPPEDSEVSEDSNPTEDSEVSEDSNPTEDSEVSEDSSPTEDSEVSEDSNPTEDSKVSEDSNPTEDSKVSEDSNPTQDSEISNNSNPTEDSKTPSDTSVSDNNNTANTGDNNNIVIMTVFIIVSAMVVLIVLTKSKKTKYSK